MIESDFNLGKNVSGPSFRPLPSGDIDEVVRALHPLWAKIRNTNIFMTGGTGFFGQWMLGSLLEANRRLNLEVKVTVLSRDPDGFLNRHPDLADCTELSLLAGSVESLSAARSSDAIPRFDWVIHMATESVAESILRRPVDSIGIIAEGTRRTLEFAHRVGARRMLFTSSGSVYDRRHASAPIPEDFRFARDPTDVDSSHAISGQAKRHAEALCSAYGRQFGLSVSIARCFAFLGPGLPLDGAFAAGNFIHDALSRRPLVIKGDGLSVRSYLYASDLAIWLWSILLNGTSGRAYNVGSESPVTIRELAEAIGREAGSAGPVRILAQPGIEHDYYVPSTERARGELGLAENVGLVTGIRRMLDWHSLDTGR